MSKIPEKFKRHGQLDYKFVKVECTQLIKLVLWAYVKIMITVSRLVMMISFYKETHLFE